MLSRIWSIVVVSPFSLPALLVLAALDGTAAPRGLVLEAAERSVEGFNGIWMVSKGKSWVARRAPSSKQIAAMQMMAIHHVHKSEVIHGDVKTTNFLVLSRLVGIYF